MRQYPLLKLAVCLALETAPVLSWPEGVKPGAVTKIRSGGLVRCA